MINLETEYMGMKLRNPLIVGSSSLVRTVQNIKDCEACGAGAVVLKSLFEEQLTLNAGKLYKDTQSDWHAEGFHYIMNTQMKFSESDYLEMIRDAKKEVSIPVIASVNCYSTEGWIGYAQKLQRAGADALELNISFLPSDPGRTSEQVEKLYFLILEAVKSEVSIPVAVKIGPFFSSFARFASELTWYGANSLVLFNRFYQFDIDINDIKISAGNRFSTSSETASPLRWVALLSGLRKCDIASSTGIHSGEDVIKHLLAGAQAVQLCSTLYLNGLKHMQTILKDIESWMSDHSFETIDMFRGMLSQGKSKKPEEYERLQYIKALVGFE